MHLKTVKGKIMLMVSLKVSSYASDPVAIARGGEFIIIAPLFGTDTTIHTYLQL